MTGYDAVLLLAYVAMIAVGLVALRATRGWPATQAFALPLPCYAIYVLIRRVYALATTGTGRLTGDAPLPVLWWLMVAAFVWGVAMIAWQRRGQAFRAPDGQRYTVTRAETPRGAVPVAQPARKANGHAGD